MTSLKGRFGLLLITTTVAPLAVFGILGLRAVTDATRTSVRNAYGTMAVQAATHIHVHIQHSAHLVRTLATRLGDSGMPPAAFGAELQAYALEYPRFRVLSTVDSDYRVLATSLIPGTRYALAPTAARGSIQTVSMSAVEVDDDLLPRARLIAPVDRRGVTVALLIADLSLEELWDVVDGLHLPSRGTALLLDDRGRLLAHSDPDAKAAVARGERIDHPLLSRAQHRSRLTFDTEYRTSSGSSVLAVATIVPDVGWPLLIEEPTADAYHVAGKIRVQLIGAIAVAIVVALSVGTLWSRSVIRPVQALTKGTNAIASGDLGYRVTATSTAREFGELATGFNAMADRLKSLETRARQHERQAVLGRLASGLIHDLGHPVRNVINNARLILRFYEKPSYRQQFARLVEREAALIEEILTDLRHLAGPQRRGHRPIDVNRLVADALDAFRLEATAHEIILGAEPSRDPVFVSGDSVALTRVVRNLTLNAMEAASPGGKVTATVAARQDVATIQITDNGQGMSSDQLSKLFDGNITTKRRGLGIGLTVCKHIIEQLDGAITVTSAEGQGTAVTLAFPRIAVDAIQASETEEVASDDVTTRDGVWPLETCRDDRA